MVKEVSNDYALTASTTTDYPQSSINSLSFMHFLPVSSLTGSYFLIITNSSAADFRVAEVCNSTTSTAAGNLGKLNDYYQSYLYLEAGTYFITILFYQGNDLAQAALFVNGENVTKTPTSMGTTYLEMYPTDGVWSGTKRVAPLSAQVTLTESKIHDIKFQCIGRNPGNTTTYRIPFTSITFVKMG